MHLNLNPPPSHPLAPGLHLDARRVLWLPDARTLVAADLHLGYVWAHRHAGQLLPISAPDDTIDRLALLVAEYCPAQLVLLGDIVHRALPLPAIREQLESLAARLASVTIRWITGNHDRRLESLLSKCGLPGIRLEAEMNLPPHLLMHGDQAGSATAARCLARLDPAGWLIIGHEHPAIHLHDRIASSVKCPCFLAGSQILVLPAFSSWAAGCNIRSSTFLSAFAREAIFSHAYAILAGRILPVAL
jgi:putative SbcD/Mre11-related phosphoesterase